MGYPHDSTQTHKFEQFTERGVMLCHQDKKRLKYHIIEDVMYQTPDGLMEVRVQRVYFTKQSAHKEPIILHARMITYVDVTKRKLISLLTNDMKTAPPKS